MEPGGAAAGGVSSARDADDVPPRAPTRAEALRYWLRLGCISFGGPAGQIAIMHRELVDERRWISEGRFLHALNYCMVLPGPEAQQLATYIGWLMHRTWGGIVAGALFVLPSLVVLIALSWLYVTYGNVPLVAAALYGVKPAVVAIVLHAAWRIGTRALRHPLLWVIAAAAFLAIFALHVPFPRSCWRQACSARSADASLPRAFAALRGPPRAGSRPHRARSSTTTRRRRRTRAFAARRLVAVVVVGLALWGLALGAAGALAAGATDTLVAHGRRSSPRPRCSPSAARTRCCPTCSRARWRRTGGSRRRR